MLTANMPQLVQQLNRIADVQVHDTAEQVELRMPSNTDIKEVDDVLCDALFVEPVQRTSTAHGWIIQLNKLARPRKVLNELKIATQGCVSIYLLGAA